MKSYINSIDIWMTRNMDSTEVIIHRKPDLVRTYHPKRYSCARWSIIVEYFKDYGLEIRPYYSRNWVGFYLER